MIRSYLTGASCYLLLGVVHELCHVLIAHSLLASSSDQDVTPAVTSSWWGGIGWREIILHRRFDLDLSLFDVGDVKLNISIIRHAGWITSVIIAFALHFGTSAAIEGKSQVQKNSIKWCKLAAYATALDAIWTDLLQWSPLTLGSSIATTTSTSCPHPESMISFFCGNFGVILLHAAWLSENGGQTTLDILRKMIEVTMMRGAQSGGIVTFENKNKNVNDNDDSRVVEMKSIRSRVVKSKRGDL